MKTYKAVIIDDEESAQNILFQLLKRYEPDIEVVATCSNLIDGVEAIKTKAPHLVFLDVEMPNYAGYEITSFFESFEFDIIFITAYDQYAIKAFELSAIDYVLKPIQIDRLKIALERFKEKQAFTGMEEAYKALKTNLNSPSFSRIIIPHQGNQKILKTADIYAFEASEAYTTIHCNEGKFMVSKNLKHFENLLEEHPTFFRSHKSWLINIEHIESYSKSKLRITLRESLEVRLSKYKKANFEAIFSR
jgi:two-component system LytT family response regulator